MTFMTTIRSLRHRMTEKELEDAINILEEERKRRGLLRSDDILDKKRLKGV